MNVIRTVIPVPCDGYKVQVRILSREEKTVETVTVSVIGWIVTLVVWEERSYESNGEVDEKIEPLLLNWYPLGGPCSIRDIQLDAGDSASVSYTAYGPGETIPPDTQ